MTVTTHNEAKLKTFDAFAPFADALEAMLNLEVPGVARDFAKRMTGAGEKLMTDGRGAVENATATIENAAVSSIREFGKISRAFQTALHQDAAALLAGLGQPLGGRIPDGRVPGSIRLPARPGRRRRGTGQSDRGLCQPSGVRKGRVRQIKALVAKSERAKPA